MALNPTLSEVALRYSRILNAPVSRLDVARAVRESGDGTVKDGRIHFADPHRPASLLPTFTILRERIRGSSR